RPRARGSACPSSCRRSATSSRPLLADLVGARAPLLGADALVHGVGPPALVVLVVRPQVAQPRHDLVGEQLRGMPRLPVRHVAVVEQAEQMTDAQTLDAFLELLAHGLGAARDDEALVHELLPREVLEDLLPRAREL